MDGQEFVDQVQKPGYMIAFNLMLRPVLMIFGLMLGYVTFGSLLWFVNNTFLPAAESLGQTVVIGGVGVIVLIVMISYIDFQIAMRSFHLITELPDRVTRWFGQAGDRLHDDEHARKTSNMFVGAMENRFNQVAGGMFRAGNPAPPPGGVKPKGPGPTGNGAAATTPAAGSPGSSDGNNTKKR